MLGSLHQSLLDISVPDHEWHPEQITPSNFRPQVSHNRVFALRIGKSSLVVVPRPGQGVCHIGRIAGPFELVDDPPWAEDYLSLRQAQGLEIKNKRSHLGDIVQTWPVESFRTVPFPLVPRWISYSLLSRNTIGWINDRPDGGVTAVDVLGQLYDEEPQDTLVPTDESEEIEARLLNWLSPSSFEQITM